MGLFGDWRAKAEEIRQSRKREGDAYWFIASIADLDAKWPLILAGHPYIAKIFLLDAREHPPVMPDTGLPVGHGLRPSVVPEIVRRAHAAGLRVAAHIERAVDFETAVRAGVRMVVGSDWFGATAWNEVQALRSLNLWDDLGLLRLWAVETPQAIFPRRIGGLDAGRDASFLG